MPAEQLPEDGELRLGSAVLQGRRVRAVGGTKPEVAWATSEPVPGVGQIWLELSGLAVQTGLQPVLWSLQGTPLRSPKKAEQFEPPPGLAEIDGIDGGVVLAQLWEERAVDDGDEESAEWIDAMIEPFSRDFPGLAAPGEEQRPAPELAAVLDALPPLHLCLAAADRPGDFLTAVGWGTTEAWWEALPSLSAVLRSWEDRFGARLLQIGPGAELRLLVSRPPQRGREQLLAAAELWAFGHTAWGGYVHAGASEATTVEDIARTVVGQPIWGFWWD